MVSGPAVRGRPGRAAADDGDQSVVGAATGQRGSGAESWENYARAVMEWTEFLAEHGVGLFDSRYRLKAALCRCAEHRAAGPVRARFAATTWAQHTSILSLCYRWAMDEGYVRRGLEILGVVLPGVDRPVRADVTRGSVCAT
jgi:hypothetical protein